MKCVNGKWVHEARTPEQIAAAAEASKYLRVIGVYSAPVKRRPNSGTVRCRDCGAPGAVDSLGLGISCGCAAAR